MNAYKGNKNLHTSTLIKIVIHCKLNKYNTINNRSDTSAYCSILNLVREELYNIADGDFKDENIGIDNPEDKDVSINNPKDKDINIDGTKDKNISVDTPENKDINTDNSAKENDLGRDSNTN